MTSAIPSPLLQASDALTKAVENAAHALRALNLGLKEKAKVDVAAAIADLQAAALAISALPDAPDGLPRPRAVLVPCPAHGSYAGEDCDAIGGLCVERRRLAGEPIPA